MKRRKKLHLTTAIFLIMAALSIVFVLSDSGNMNNKTTITYPDTTVSYPKASNQNKINPIKKPNLENINPIKTQEQIDWQPIIEKYKGKEVSNIKTDKKVIALTFDAGGNADGVDPILKTLKKENVKGTFFLTGKFIEKFPDYTKEIIDFSKDLGSHSYSHPHFVNSNFTQEQVNEELEKTEKLLSNLNANFKPFFRFPFGERNSKYIGCINDKNYINIGWSVDSLGWEGMSGGMSKEKVRDRVIGKTTPGAIVLMHLGSNPDDGTNLDSEALPEIIQELKSKGYEFVTLTELLKLGT